MWSLIGKELRKAWGDSAVLTGTTITMLVVFILSLAGIVLDDRMITGVPAWLKPAKFAISFAIFCGTMAWLYRYLQIWPRMLRIMAWVLALVLIIEVAIIDLQAARGVTSHFNVATPLDGTLFSVMGGAIALLWLASIGVLVALFRQRFVSGAWGWWLRLGMLTTVLGSATGGFMVSPNPEQIAALRAAQPLSSVGAHTVGGPDGGPGIPGVGWSTRHGDLRIAHFLGLHGIQILPLIGWLRLRRRTDGVAIILAIAASYITLVGLLAWQALRGQSLIAPDLTTLLAFGVWSAATAGTFILARAKGKAEPMLSRVTR